MLSKGTYSLGEGIWATKQREIKDLIQSNLKKDIRHIVAFLQWNLTVGSAFKAVIQTKRAKSLGIDILWCALTPNAEKILKKLGCNATRFLPTVFCREDLYFPSEVEKSTDAIYIASMESYKRVYLAREIQNLEIIRRNYKENIQSEIKEWGLSHAKINNTWVGRTEMHIKINQSHCGLALSKIEGAMYANTEYLLCGTPVVSTPSRGGRDAWYEKHNHIICNDTPHAVAMAVESIKNKTAEISSKEEISAMAREKLYKDRETITDKINKIWGAKIKSEVFSPNGCTFYNFKPSSCEYIPHSLIKDPNPKQQ
jgi:hypothetical protein